MYFDIGAPTHILSLHILSTDLSCGILTDLVSKCSEY